MYEVYEGLSKAQRRNIQGVTLQGAKRLHLIQLHSHNLLIDLKKLLQL